MKNPSSSSHRGIISLAVGALVFLLACHITKDEGTEEVFTFPNITQSLQGSDTVRIVLKEPGGRVIDILYYGPVTGASFTNLVAPNYNGGKVVVSIEGFKDGEVVYKVEKIYSGTSGVVDSTIVIISGPIPKVPADSVRISPRGMVLRAKGAEGNLQARVFPESLSQAVLWSSLDPSVATVSLQGKVAGLDTGAARIVATSIADPMAADTLKIQVLPQLRVETVAFDRASLELYAEGSAQVLQVTVLPQGANPKVRFSIEDPAFASIQEGMIKGLKQGQTRVFAKSEEDSTKGASMQVVIHSKPAAAVDSVAVSPDTLRLYTGGETISLTAAIFPAVHEARFAWQSAAPGIATVDGTGKVSPVSAGRVFVRARSLVDSTKGDSAVVIVRKDTPRIDVGGDTTISLNGTLVFNPKVTQDYGTLILARWDLDDIGSWDDSGSVFKPVSRTYVIAKEYTVRFYAKDSEGNDTTVSRKVRVVNGPVILIQSPEDGSYTNLNPITVNWTVDGAPETSQETLKAGANTISRSAKNAAGETFSASVTVHLDTVPPSKPLVKGPAGPISTLRPAWTWETAGGGNGTFRHRLDIDNLATGGTVTTDTGFTPPGNLTVGTHTLFVQERDAAGNWSQSGSFTVRIDTMPPAPPAVTLLTATPTKNRLPSWTWSGSSSEGTLSFRYKLDNNDLRTGATVTSILQFTPLAGSELSEGPHTLYVQQADSAGNWSTSGSAAVRIDTTAPLAPKVTSPVSPTNDRTPSWTFLPQGGGNGTYRYKLNDRNLAVGATETSTPGFTPLSDLAAGAWVLHVQERDSAGNWSASDSAAVTIDLSSSGAPTVNLRDGSPSNVQTPRWTWKQAAGGNGNFRYKFNDSNLNTGATESRDTLYDHQAPLAAGTYTFYVQQQNAAGNWSSSGSRTVHIDTTRPAAPTVTTVQSSPTNERRPTWNWTHTEPGVGYYRYSLDNAAFRDTNSTSFRPGQNLSEANHSLRIQERDSAGNWSDIASASVQVDATAPNTPVFNQNQPRSPVSSLQPTWSWTSGGGGSGNRFQYSLDNGAFTEITGTLFKPTSNLSEGPHILRIQELDQAGNPSAIASRQLILSTRGYLGTAGQGVSQANSISMAISGGDTVYSAMTVDGRLRVQRFVNGSWQGLTSGLFSGTTYDAHVNVNKAGIPYVAFSEYDNGQEVSVMRMVGGSWTNVGFQRFSSENVYNPRIYFSPTDIPYVLYGNGSQGGTMLVSRFGGFWENLGQAGLPDFQVIDYEMAFQKNGDPIIAFASFTDDRVTVVRYSQSKSAWDTLGNIIALDKYSDAVDLVVNNNDEPIVAFLDKSNNRITVLRLTGNTWSNYGNSGMPEAVWGQVGLSLGVDQSPMIAFGNAAEVTRASVMTLNGSTWQHIGPTGLSEAQASMITLKANSNGVPHISYQDGANSWGISVFKTSFDP